jgi:nitroimidazol reductase NimA-like FMN-containing flavoprotein (pyridoxamine 5'-phosphate oxidase superfamily)
MRVDSFGLELLSREECVRLLSTTAIGRIGFHSAALPVILPVAYAVDGDSIVVRVRGGSQLDIATREAVVAFEADDLDASSGGGGGWSVAVTGVTSTITEPAELERMRALALDEWSGLDDRFIRISLDMLSGRRRRRPVSPGRR